MCNLFALYIYVIGMHLWPKSFDIWFKKSPVDQHSYSLEIGSHCSISCFSLFQKGTITNQEWHCGWYFLEHPSMVDRSNFHPSFEGPKNKKKSVLRPLTKMWKNDEVFQQDVFLIYIIYQQLNFFFANTRNKIKFAINQNAILCTRDSKKLKSMWL